MNQCASPVVQFERFGGAPDIVPDVFERVWSERDQPCVNAGELLDRALHVAQADGADFALGLGHNVRRAKLLQQIHINRVDAKRVLGSSLHRQLAYLPSRSLRWLRQARIVE